MSTAGRTRTLQIITGVVTGATALSGFAGVVGLLGGGLSFGPQIDARLPFDSLALAGIALLCFVAVPMTIAAVTSFRPGRHTNDFVFGSGVLMVAWIGVELAYIKVYSWFHPTYLAVAFLVLALGWVLERLNVPSPDPGHGRLEPQHTSQGPLAARSGSHTGTTQQRHG